MTKRMLSLLLALVMTLSLCVPALAAGDFAAEAVTDVEEQAPVAPVALEPEADEAVVAAVTVDEPVEAAFADGETVTEAAGEAEYNQLHAVIDQYKIKYQQAKNGEVIGKAYHYYDWIKGNPDKEIADFITDYEAALYYYNDWEQLYPINKKYITGLTNSLWTEGSDNHIYGPNYVDNGWFRAGEDGNNGFDSIRGELEKIAANPDEYDDGRLQPGWFEKVEDLYYEMNYVVEHGYPIKNMLAALTKAWKGNDAVWYAIAGYQHCYANDDIGTSLEPGKAVKANKDDYEALTAALDALQAKIDGAAISLPDNVTAMNNAKTWLATVKAQTIDETTGSGLKKYVTHDDVNHLIIDAGNLAKKITLDTRSTKIVSWRLNDVNKTNLLVFVELANDAIDDKFFLGKYRLKAQMGTSVEYFDVYSTDDIKLDDPGLDAQTRYYGIINKHDLLKGTVEPFKNNETLTVQLLDADGNQYGETVNITISDNNYPQVIGSGFAVSEGNDWNTVVLKDQFYLKFNASLQYFQEFTTGRIEITRPDKTTTKKNLDNVEGTLIDNATNAYWSDNPVQVGDYTVSYYTKNTKTDEEAPAQTVTITVSPISSYSGYAKLTKAITAAAKYESMVATTASKMTTADARAAVARHLTTANYIVTNAATTPYTTANKATVDKVTDNLNDAMKNLTAAADQSALDTALEKAAALVKTDYTLDTWNALQKAVTAGEKAKKDHTTDSVADKKALEDAAKQINAAIAALAVVKPTAELNALQALIDSVPAKLAADDYTEASKAAVNTALIEAKAVLATAGATKSQLQAAADKLEAALNALTVAPKGPQPPVGGTGWTEYNGVWYYFINNVMKTNFWVTNGSNHNLWYHMGADGALDTGFQYIEDKTFGHGWYMLQGDNSNGMLGAMLTGWQDTKIAGMGWFIPDHNGNYGDCTWTKSWGNYYPIANTWDVGGTHITK